jgi:exonuclease III
VKIATWNMNSVRARLERLLAWLTKAILEILMAAPALEESSESTGQ